MNTPLTCSGNMARTQLACCIYSARHALAMMSLNMLKWVSQRAQDSSARYAHDTCMAALSLQGQCIRSNRLMHDLQQWSPPATSPLALTRALDRRLPSGTRITLTTPLASTADEKTLRSNGQPSAKQQSCAGELSQQAWTNTKQQSMGMPATSI